ncbi:MAG: flagellar M-ring protein FliF [Methylococcaceae bacterium]|nr:flagellar M-ring protein FliF [Methylococcaceae bacterium]
MSEKDIIPGELNQSLVANDRSHPALKELAKLSVNRQLGVMLGLAVSVAIGVAVVMWSQAPTYDVLMTGMTESDSAEMIEALKKSGAEYKIDAGSGAILVPPAKIRELKLQLAAQGLPKSPSSGYDLLDKEAGFGTSKGVEQVRFQRALEGEIARTVMTIQNIKSARVLLAMPKQSVFVREHKKPSASVVVNLYQGRSLEKGQVESIVHLVSSSVPLLEPEQVTVVDQRGNLLNSKANAGDTYLSSKQFDYKNNIEEHLMARIGNILTPLVGAEGLRTQISADVDFTVTEETQEKFNPNGAALRSEQVNDIKNELSTTQGVPGALSNQPPAAGQAPENAIPDPSKPAAVSTPTSENKSATRNFELDKTITHTRLAAGELKRLSVAVVVDNKRLVQDGESISQAYSQEEINRFTDLVKQAIGFNAERGDQVTVTNSAFRVVEEMEALPAAALWEQAWFMDLLKQVAAALVVLFLVFGVLRPTMRGLVGRSEAEKKSASATANQGFTQYDGAGNPIAFPAVVEDGNKPLGLPNDIEDLLLLDAPQSYEKRLEYVRKLADEDPQLVAQVIKSWIKEEVK